ncbi:MAG: CDP-diacylglycerol--serine O-phosphatidyltransferase [Oligoflexia bacterium]|nr:CDP-diacylglycerol--serine O-phosphatidyltransferase [Oligoflexia bacterium]MBF0364379.1 CDP-diacylglycerol--serine O-phosphatidyltransferase [Oligoflexia bacterium]
MQEQQRRWPAFLPSVFTGLNMACGFASIMVSIQGDFYRGSMFLMLGILFDLVDGRVARWTGTESTFGEQFDSMSDVVSFGVAPAILYYHRFLTDLNRPGMVLAFFFMLCGAMRLARFNANIDKISSDHFQGLPIPLGAMALVGLTLLSLAHPEVLTIKPLLISYIVFYAVLMISNIPFPSFKHSPLIKKYRGQVLLLVFAIFALILLFDEYMVLAIVSLYVISAIIYFLTHRQQFKDIFSGDDNDEVIH